jgi:hypothetical protein
MLRLVTLVFGAVFFSGCTAKASPFKSITLCDFERTADPVAESQHYDIPTALKKPNYTNHDFRWNSSGYAVMEPATKDEAKAAKNKPFYKFFQGKTAARIRFTVPADYKKPNPENKPKTWETGISLATDSYTALPVTDWSAFRYLALNAYNPGEKDQRLFVRIRDAYSNMTETSALVAGGASILEFDLKMLSESRLNTKDIRAISLYLNTADQDKDPVLVLDNLQLHSGTVEERQKAALEEEQAAEEEEDWDAQEEDAANTVAPVVSRPSGITGAPAAVSGAAK